MSIDSKIKRNKRVLKLSIWVLIILSMMTWGFYVLAIGMLFVGTSFVDGSPAVKSFVGAWILVSYISYVPWVIALFLTGISLIINVRNDAMKYVIGILMIPVLLSAGLWGIIYVSVGFIQISLKVKSPVTFYLTGLEPRKVHDVSQLFEDSASDTEIFALLSEQGYPPRGRRETSSEKVPKTYEYVFKRTVTCVPTVARMGTTLRVKFDEDGEFISAAGSRSLCNM